MVVSLINSSKALLKVAENLRSGRLAKGVDTRGVGQQIGCEFIYPEKI